MTPTRNDSLRLLVEGEPETDSTTVYIGGMDLANILRASMPSQPNPNNHEGWDIYPAVTMRVEISYRKASQ